MVWFGGGGGRMQWEGVMVAVGVVMAAVTVRAVPGHDIILKPLYRSAVAANEDGESMALGKEEIALIFIQGADIENQGYVPLAHEMQSSFWEFVSHSPIGGTEYSGDMWVALPDMVLNTAQPVDTGRAVARAKEALAEAGYTGSEYLYAGHSLGGVMISDHLARDADDSQDAVAQALFGSYLTRSLRNDTENPYPTRTVAIAGDLDGLARVSRMAEATYAQVMEPALSFGLTVPETDADPDLEWPVVVVSGMSHMQAAAVSTPIPDNVRRMDLQPEISYSEAHRKAGRAAAAFFVTVVEDRLAAAGLVRSTGGRLRGAAVGLASARNYLKAESRRTQALVGPMVAALLKEQYHNFKPPCDCEPTYCESQDWCYSGSRWTPTGQLILAGEGFVEYGDGQTAKVDIAIKDSFHPASQTNPVHLAYYADNCTEAEALAGPGACTLHGYTVTENVYDSKDELDTGYWPLAATEMQCKLMTRQLTYETAGVAEEDTDFDALDGPDLSLCGKANQAAVDWALARVKGTPAGARYEESGEKYVIGADTGPYNMGPLWLDHPLKFTENEEQTEVVIQSPTLVTETDYPISLAAGFHYCKLLSPARVMEWIFVDSLRVQLGLSSAD